MDPRQELKSLKKALRILGYLNQMGDATTSQVASALGLPRSTANRILEDRAPWRGVGLATSSRSPARLAGLSGGHGGQLDDGIIAQSRHGFQCHVASALNGPFDGMDRPGRF